MAEPTQSSKAAPLLVSCVVDDITEHVGPALPLSNTNAGLADRKPILVSEVDGVSVFIGNSVPPQEIYAPAAPNPGQPDLAPNLGAP